MSEEIRTKHAKKAKHQETKIARGKISQDPSSGREGPDACACIKAMAIETTGHAVAMADADAKLIYVNDAFLKTSGYTRDEVLGKSASMLCSGQNGEEFLRQIQNSVLSSGKWQGEVICLKKSGDDYPAWVCINSARDARGNVGHYSGFSLDISVLKENEQRLHHMAHYDLLTNLPNRSLMYDRLKQALSLARRYRYSVAVMLLDVDRFKEVNDTLGHHIGDQLLMEAAFRLVGCVRESDTIARMGGDEFLVILSEVGNATNVAHVAQKFLDALSKPFELEGNEVFVSASIGIVMFPNDGEDIHMLVKNADTAMYHAKAQGKNNFKFFTEGINKSTVERFMLESRFRRALEKLEFQLNYQPKFDISSGKLTGMEALLRWYHPEQGSVNPSLFIPLAEETGLVVQLGEWVVREACRQNKAWQNEGLQPLRVSVNLSARHFHKKDLIAMVSGILDETGLDPRYLMIEITESTIIQDVEETIDTLNKFRSMGIGVSVDDFGTGFSSLNYLNRFSLDELKIDKTFITDIASGSDSRKVITAIIALAHNLKLSVVAEGVETKEQLEFLKESNCDQVQGYLFSVPLSSEQFRNQVQRGFDSLAAMRGHMISRE